MEKDNLPEERKIGEELVELKDGYLEDFLTGEPIKKTPEEKVRQVYLRRLNREYDYPKKHMMGGKNEFYIQKGSKKIGPADIVVFNSEKQTLDNIHIVVEIKSKEREDGIEQLKSYLSPTKAKFGVWFNGKEIEHFQVKDEPPYFRKIPDIPKYGENLEDVGLYRKKDLEPFSELISVFQTIHNHIYANEGFSREKVFNEMLKLVFIKMVDEKSGKPKCDFRVTDKELEKVQEGGGQSFEKRIRGMFDRVKKEYGDVFDRSDRLNLSKGSLAITVSQLQKGSLTKTPSEVKGTAFQTFIEPFQRSERGEFFTPYPILQLGVKMLNPSDGEKIIDPACGSGGFLIEDLKYVWDKFKAGRSDVSKSEIKDMVIRYAHNYIRGIDINQDLARVAKMYMILYDDGHTGIFSEDSLEKFDKIRESATKAGANSFIGKEEFDVLLTNPPFGTKGKVTKKRILRQFELGHKWEKKNEKYQKTNDLQEGQTPEILFIERSLQFLNQGGRMGIVLPDGILTNSTTQYVRDFINQNARILAVVSLPDGTFRQAGVNPKTSVLFLQKLSDKVLERKKEDNYKIFTAIAEEIGYDLDKKTAETKYKRDEKGRIVKDEDGNPVIETDVPQIIEKFEEFKSKNNLGF